MRQHFENYIRSRCRSLGISQTELARRAGMSRENLYRLLRGEVSNPSIETLHGLAASLGVSALQLMRLYFDDLSLGRGTLLPSRQRNDHTSFVQDVTIPDGTLVGPNQAFTKTWAIQNTGDSAWRGRRLICQDEDYVLAKRLSGGFLVPVVDCRLTPAAQVVAVPDAGPGEVVEVSVDFTSPALPCTVISLWKMTDAEGQLCFPGHMGLWVQVRVVRL